MRATDIQAGVEYAYKRNSYGSTRRVKAIEPGGSGHTVVKFMDTAPSSFHRQQPGAESSVPNRTLISTWEAADREARLSGARQKFAEAEKDATKAAEGKLREIWNGAMEVIHPGAEDAPKFESHDGFRSSLLKLDPEKAVALAYRLSLHAGVAAYMHEHKPAIDEILRERDETIAAAEAERDETLASLTKPEEVAA